MIFLFNKLFLGHSKKEYDEKLKRKKEIEDRINYFSLLCDIDDRDELCNKIIEFDFDFDFDIKNKNDINYSLDLTDYITQLLLKIHFFYYVKDIYTHAYQKLLNEQQKLLTFQKKNMPKRVPLKKMIDKV